MADFSSPDAGPSPLDFRRRESERGIYTEKKFGDDWLALWTTDDLPAGANVIHVTVVPYRGERAVLPFKDGRLSLPEGDALEGESGADAVRRLVSEQCGILDPAITHLGHFELKATHQNPRAPVGTTAYDVFYVLEVGSLADNPGDASYERRIVLQRDLNEVLRNHYIERRREYTDALDRWLVKRLAAARKDAD